MGLRSSFPLAGGGAKQLRGRAEAAAADVGAAQLKQQEQECLEQYQTAANTRRLITVAAIVHHNLERQIKVSEWRAVGLGLYPIPRPLAHTSK